MGGDLTIYIYIYIYIIIINIGTAKLTNDCAT